MVVLKNLKMSSNAIMFGRDAKVVFNNLLETAKRVPNPYAVNFVLRSLSHLSSAFSSVSGQSSAGKASAIESTIDTETEKRQDSDLLLNVLERVTGSISSTASTWYLNGQPALKDKDAKARALATEITSQLGAVTGFEFQSVKDMEETLSLKQEVKKWKSLYQDAFATISNLEDANYDLRQELEKAKLNLEGKGEVVDKAVEVATAAFREEIKNLQEAVTMLTKERDETRMSSMPQRSRPYLPWSGSVTFGRAASETPVEAQLPVITAPEKTVAVKVCYLQKYRFFFSVIVTSANVFTHSHMNGQKCQPSLQSPLSGKKSLMKPTHPMIHWHRWFLTTRSCRLFLICSKQTKQQDHFGLLKEVLELLSQKERSFYLSYRAVVISASFFAPFECLMKQLKRL
jgi:hypothetical protein